MAFDLYKNERRTFPYEDYGQLIDEVQVSGAKTAIEFGPGISTLALIESGLEEIVTCEHDQNWIDCYQRQYAKHKQVKFYKFKNEPEVVILDLDPDKQFDFGFVDTPKGYAAARVPLKGQEDCSRLNTCMAALERAPIVLLHDAYRPLERATLGRLNAMGYKITMLPPRMAKIERQTNAT